MKKITLLAASALLLLTACGQVESTPTEITLPPTTVVQEDAQQPQVTPEPTTAVKESDTVSVTAQEQPQKEKAPQTEAVPQATQPLEPVKEPTPAENIPSETVHAKTGYEKNGIMRCVHALVRLFGWMQYDTTEQPGTR